MSNRLGVRLRAVLVAVLLPVLIVLGGAAAAHAERLATPDAAGDVVRSTFDEESTDPQSSPAPDQTAVDITRTVVTHRAARLRMSVRFRDLHRAPDHLTYIRVRTPEGQYEIYVERRSGAGTISFAGGDSQQRECIGLRWAASNATDRVVVSLPTSCLGSPRWVRVGVGAASPDTIDGDPLDEAGFYFADDGHRTGAVGNSVRVGQQVHRGLRAIPAVPRLEPCEG